MVDEGILYKKRGIGMFVAKDAKNRLVGKRKQAFADEYVVPLLQEAEKLGISENEIIELIKNFKEGE